MVQQSKMMKNLPKNMTPKKKIKWPLIPKLPSRPKIEVTCSLLQQKRKGKGEPRRQRRMFEGGRDRNEAFKTSRAKRIEEGKKICQNGEKVSNQKQIKWNYPHFKNDFLTIVIDQCWWLFNSLGMKWASVVIYWLNRKVLGLSPISSTTTSFFYPK